MAGLQKKKLEDIVEQNWNIGVGGLKLGNALLGLGFNNKGKLTGNIGTKLGNSGVTIGASTDDVGGLLNKLTGKNRGPDNKTKTSRKNTGYNTSLKPGQPGYKSALRRRQEAAQRNQ